MRPSSCAFLLGPAILIAAALVPAPVGQKKASLTSLQKDVFPILEKYCGGCHGDRNGPMGVSLLDLQTEASFKGKKDVWKLVEQNIANKRMPPAGMPAPSQAQRDIIAAFIRSKLGTGKPDPGHVTIRRLNRIEYDNTVRDLFGIDFHASQDFPSDEVGYGFDNIGDVLSMSPLLMDKYLKAAQDIADRVIYVPGSRTWNFPLAEIDGQNSSVTADGGRELYSNGTVASEIDFPVAATYRLRVVAYQQKAGDENARMSLVAGGKLLRTVEVAGTEGHAQTFEAEFQAPIGTMSVGASFVNDFYRPKTDKEPQADRNLILESMQVSGPTDSPKALPASESKIIFLRPTPSTRVACERKILSTFAARAYRRPPTDSEVSQLVQIAELAHKEGDPFERGIQLGITAALCSPKFLFRAERPVNGVLNSYEIASRLSYFLWSTMPDQELFELAARNRLQDPAVLDRQVDRMLKDQKAQALADNFAGQWLQTRKLTVIQPDDKMFPDFTDQIRHDMATEMSMFFEDVMRNDRSVLDFLDGKYSFLNGPLAHFYGIAGVEGREFRRVEMPPQRLGIFTRGGVLTVTSNPTRTSPVKRGKWILENILGTPPPPPPPGVGVLKDDGAADPSASLRARMEQHRKDPMCAACHKQMDGLGFALENFDAVGKWRAKDGKFDIDASGELPDGSKFDGPTELSGLLMKKRSMFVRCLTEKMLTYALGRGLEDFDEAAVDKIATKVSDGEYKFSVLVKGVVESDPFRRADAR